MKSKPTVVGVISSARQCSNSAAMVREALKGAAEAGAVTKEVYLPEYELKYCTGCLSCMKRGKCRLQDGFNEPRDQLYEADGIIWGRRHTPAR